MPAPGIDDDLAYVKAGVGDDLDTVLVYSLLRTHSHLSPFLDTTLREQRLTASQLNALLLLRSAGEEGMLMGRIGQELVVAKSNVTGLVDRLEREGLVTRCDHSDRRATVVRLAPAGAALLEQAVPRHAELMSQLTGTLSDADKRTLIRLLSRLRHELRRRRGGA